MSIRCPRLLSTERFLCRVLCHNRETATTQPARPDLQRSQGVPEGTARAAAKLQRVPCRASGFSVSEGTVSRGRNMIANFNHKCTFQTSRKNLNQGVRAHRLAPPQRLATGLDRYDLWITLVVHEGRDSLPEPSRVSSSTRSPHLSAHTTVDGQVAGILARVQRCRQDTSSLTAFTVPTRYRLHRQVYRSIRSLLDIAALPQLIYESQFLVSTRAPTQTRKNPSKPRKTSGKRAGMPPLQGAATGLATSYFYRPFAGKTRTVVQAVAARFAATKVGINPVAPQRLHGPMLAGFRCGRASTKAVAAPCSGGTPARSSEVFGGFQFFSSSFFRFFRESPKSTFMVEISNIPCD